MSSRQSKGAALLLALSAGALRRTLRRTKTYRRARSCSKRQLRPRVTRSNRRERFGPSLYACAGAQARRPA